MRTNNKELSAIAAMIPGVVAISAGIVMQDFDLLLASTAFVAVAAPTLLAFPKISQLKASFSKNFTPNTYENDCNLVIGRMKPIGVDDTPLKIANDAFNLKMIDTSTLKKVVRLSEQVDATPDETGKIKHLDKINDIMRSNLKKTVSYEASNYSVDRKPRSIDEESINAFSMKIR